jgi:hypothetical protein
MYGNKKKIIYLSINLVRKYYMKDKALLMGTWLRDRMVM